jgi:hypothetical protein
MSDTSPAAAAQAALTLADLERVAEHRHGLYLFKQQGYATGPGGPYLSEATAQALVDAGLARFEPSGGRHGSVKVTAKGQKAALDRKLPR